MLRRLLSITDAPSEYRSNFIHFFFDIGWFGILSGSAASFLGVYLTRLGAGSVHIGLLSAVGAVVSICLAIPAGHWLEKRQIGKAIFWTSIGQRVIYLFWVPLPWLFGAQGQIWAMIAFAFVMAIPASALGVGFNALFAAAVPAEWRAAVAGTRNVVLSITFMAASLTSGYILSHVPFPTGYQIVFAIGAFGALMSSLHLYFVHPVEDGMVIQQNSSGLDKAGDLQPQAGASPVPSINQAAHRGWRGIIRMDIWRTPFGIILIVLLVYTIAQNLALPLFPIYFVRNLGLTDSQIGIGTAIFYFFHLVGSTQLARITRKIGHHKITAYGSMATAIYPIVLGLSHTPYSYFFLQVIGGLVWSMVGGALANYLLESIPVTDMPAHLAWYSLIANASVLIGSLLGPVLSNWMGIGWALIIFGFLRLAGGYAILAWGHGSHQTKDRASV
jgi:MFS family permease